MNIFFLDENPIIAAQMLADVHCGSKNFGGKMILESTQMLINCYSEQQRTIAPKTQKGTVRKLSHINHPCSQWVLKSEENFTWLLRHAQEMLREKKLGVAFLIFVKVYLIGLIIIDLSLSLSYLLNLLWLCQIIVR